MSDGRGAAAAGGSLSRRQVLKSGVYAAAAAAGTGAPGLLWPSTAHARSLAAATGAGPGPPGAPVALSVDGMPSPIGLSGFDVHFAWQLDDDRRGAVQDAYRLVVSRTAAAGALAGAGVEVWDSGRVASSRQAFVPYAGPPLDPDTVYGWKVQTWAGPGRPGPFSSTAGFETGLQDGDWAAHWIGRAADTSSLPDQYAYARKTFLLAGSPVVRARAYVSGDQQYELSVNGTRAGKGQAFCYPDSQYYETLDITGLLVAGRPNAIGLLYSWLGATKGRPPGAPGVIAQVSVLHADGTRVTIVTDATWKVRDGAWLPGTQRDIEGDNVGYTENIDGRLVPTGWDSAAYDDSQWEQPSVLGPAGTHPWTHLVPVRTRVVVTPVPAASLTRLGSGAVVADFGKVYAASPAVQFHQGVAGRVISMRAGYLLDHAGPGRPGVEEGQVSTTHGTQHTNMSYSYVQSGGAEQFAAFDYLGFRYLQVDDPGEALQSTDVVAMTRHTGVPDEQAASFSCSEKTVEAIFELARHSALYSAQEQFVDTPTREKGPWLWDGFNESQTTMVAFAEQNLTRKSLLEFAQSQRRYWPNGAVNKIYPTGLGAGDIDEFTEIYPEWVWQYWLNTGDDTVLAAVYPTVAHVSDYVQRSVDPTSGLVTGLPSTEHVDQSLAVLTRINVLAANLSGRAAEMAQALGRPATEIARHQDRQQALVESIDTWLTRYDGLYVDGLSADGSPTRSVSQDANACALAYGVVPDGNREAVAAHIASLGMDVEPRTATEVLRALAGAGRDADVVRLLTDSRIDGWANILAQGATFTWEVWRPSDANGDSMSHGWGSNVLVEIVRLLLGVQPTGPGYRTLSVNPPLSALAWARGTVPTPRGPVSVSWQRPSSGATGFALDLDVPANAQAEVGIPVSGRGVVTEGGRPVEQAPGVTVVSTGAPRTVVRVGAGSYRFAHGPVGS